MGICFSGENISESPKEECFKEGMNEANENVSPIDTSVQRQPRLKELVTTLPERNVAEYYEFEGTPTLGEGVSGNVVVAIHRETGIKYALKTLIKRNVRPEKLARLRNEISIMLILDHPNIVKLHEVFETNDVIFLIIELCTGGELLARLYEQKESKYCEATAADHVYTMLSAIRYCHEKNIVHRDLKLENFLFENSAPDSPLKLIDFGLSQKITDGKQIKGSVGTPYYVSPEVLTGEEYTAKVDVWSIGVITYMLLSGTPPFYGQDDKETLDAVRLGRWEFKEHFDRVSIEARKFITSCLSRRVHKRPSAAEAMKHPWFESQLRRKGTNNEEDFSVSLDIIARLRAFERRSKLMRVCMEVIAYTLLPDQIRGLTEEFKKFDVDQKGEISYADVQRVLNEHGGFNKEDIDKIFEGVDFEKKGVLAYHDFIASTFSRRQIREDNLKIAFEKMSHHSEYITRENLACLITNEEGCSDPQDTIQCMLKDAGIDIASASSRGISFPQFRRLMFEGQESPKIRRRATLFDPASSPLPSSPALTSKKWIISCGQESPIK